jgi:hypothetical protein
MGGAFERGKEGTSEEGVGVLKGLQEAVCAL